MSDLVEIFVTETAEEVTLNVTPNLIEVNVIKGIGDINLTTTGNSGSSTYNTTSKTLNVPTYTLSGLGGQPLLTNPITGTGTTNRLPKFTGATTLGNSLIFDNGTNVGIGTSSPVSIGSYTTLDVRGTNGSLLYMGIAGATATLRLIGEGTDGYIDNLTTGGSLLFRTNNATERMRITSSGNVGIGTTSPTSRLHVSGLPSFADNTTAIAGGLTVGAFYHTAGVLKVVI
jgi:hypothetical protein